MLVTKSLDVKISRQNIRHYRDKGYQCNVGEIINVDVADVTRKCKLTIVVKCDYCGKLIDRQIGNHTMQTEKDIIKKDCCTKCAGKKRLESNLIVHGIDSLTKLQSTKDKMKATMLERYGVEHQMYLQETKDKIRETNMNLYGVEHSMHRKEIVDKLRVTSLDRYGVEHYTKTQEYKVRVKETNLNKYGVENVFQHEEFREKQKNTVLERYGHENVFQNEDIKLKSKKTIRDKYGVDHPMHVPSIKRTAVMKQKLTRYINGTTPDSKQQNYIHSLIKGEKNYLVDSYNLDIAFPEEKLYVEYNGGGHDLQVKIGKLTPSQFKQQEMKRYFFLKSLGWKQVEINSPRDFLPSDEVIIKFISAARYDLLQNNEFEKSHVTINIGEVKNDLVYGELRKL